MTDRIFVVATLLCVSILSRTSWADERPNVLFIFADDQCFDTIRALGNEEIHTPNLDRLVERGTTFTHTYNMGGWSGAICVASRTMLNTGRFLWHAKDVENDLKEEAAQGRLWSLMMKEAGYRTYMTGKWHVKYDAAKAFDVAAHVRGGMPNQTDAGYNRPVEGQPDKWSPYDPQFGGFWKGGKHWSEVVADDALEFLEDARQHEAPFFMYIAFNAPHDPRQSPKEYVDMYPQQKIRIPASFQPLYPYHEEIGLGRNQRDEKLAPFPRTEYAVRVNRQEYYAIITHMDHQIGRILDNLEATEQAKNTWIFFTADHGLAVGHHGMIGKQNMYDHSVRVPLMVVGPGVAENHKVDAEVYLQDVMPTSLELAGVEKPDHVEFHSLLPLLSGEQTETNYPALYGGYIDLQRMVQAGGYKLILYPKIGKARLFHLESDPHEMNDLFGSAHTQQVSQQLFQRMLQLQEETGDDLDLLSAFPDLASG